MLRKITEAHILAAVKLEIGAEPDLVLLRNNVGGMHNPSGKWVKFGLGVGSSDLVGILAPTGRWFVLEIKHHAVTTQAQLDWLEMVRRLGGFGRVLRAETEAEAKVLARAALARARDGESE